MKSRLVEAGGRTAYLAIHGRKCKYKDIFICRVRTLVREKPQAVPEPAASKRGSIPAPLKAAAQRPEVSHS